MASATGGTGFEPPGLRIWKEGDLAERRTARKDIGSPGSTAP